MDIKPLVGMTSPKGGRPTRYRETLPAEINAAILAGMKPNDIIECLESSWREMKYFSGRSYDMAKAYKALCNGRVIEEKEEQEAISASIADELNQEDYETQIETGLIEAVKTLRLILRTGTSDSAKVQAAKELLDRAKGKPVQTTQVNQNVSYTINASIPAPPNSKRIESAGDNEGEQSEHDIEGDYEIIDI